MSREKFESLVKICKESLGEEYDCLSMDPEEGILWAYSYITKMEKVVEAARKQREIIHKGDGDKIGVYRRKRQCCADICVALRELEEK